LQLNYDNYIDYSENVKISIVTRPMVNEALVAPAMQGVLSDDMKMYAVDILFKRR